jgi:hypothetical protein
VTVSPPSGSGLAPASVTFSPGNGQSVDVVVPYSQAPTITSINSATLTVSKPGSFQVNAAGTPAPTFTETGALPSGVTLSASGLLSGAPAAGSGGDYNITVTAAKWY